MNTSWHTPFFIWAREPLKYYQGFSQMMRRVHLDCKSSFMESRYLEFFLREARMQRVEWIVKESKRPSGRHGEA
jgi:hypothetical protein